MRVGDELDFTEPLVLGYGFGQWRLQPADGTAEGIFAPQNTRPAAPDEVGGDVQVGAFNVLNYFLTLDRPGRRGRPRRRKLERQADKIVPAIKALDADVLTLMEIEDTDSTGFSPGERGRRAGRPGRSAERGRGLRHVGLRAAARELYAVDRDVIRNGDHLPPDVGAAGR